MCANRHLLIWVNTYVFLTILKKIVSYHIVVICNSSATSWSINKIQKWNSPVTKPEYSIFNNICVLPNMSFI